MNIFESKESFVGSLDSVAENGSLMSLFQLAKQIRFLLGKQAYMLDRYLSMFFEGLWEITVFDAANKGFLKSIELQNVFLSLFEGTENGKLHPIYDKAKELFAKKADELPFQENFTKIYLLMILLADEMMLCSTENFIKEQTSEFDRIVDKGIFQDLYSIISNVVGEAMMEELNQKLKQRFLVVPLTTIFTQAANNNLIYQLTTRDFETSKQMFQLLLDILPDSP